MKRSHKTISTSSFPVKSSRPKASPVTKASEIETWDQFCKYYYDDKPAQDDTIASSPLSREIASCQNLDDKIKIYDDLIKIVNKNRANEAFLTEFKTAKNKLVKEKKELQKVKETIKDVKDIEEFYCYFSENYEKEKQTKIALDELEAFLKDAHSWASKHTVKYKETSYSDYTNKFSLFGPSKKDTPLTVVDNDLNELMKKKNQQKKPENKLHDTNDTQTLSLSFTPPSLSFDPEPWAPSPPSPLR